MKIRFRVNARVTVEADVNDMKQGFHFVSEVQESMGAGPCGHCESANVAPSFRQAQGYDFYSLVCQDCGHELSFGQRRDDGGLFPKMKDKEGNLIDHKGWAPPYNPGKWQGYDKVGDRATRTSAGATVPDSEIPF